ncbi:hypothetical protein IMZ11_42020, partial [Microtetraspora sp. AC03309]|uniref:TolB family protein n=1 Tax=Microtetraspora sp. AC03309 TaxID=2779376 RepID=UPI0035AF4AA5|nr:hypothetical protein [Microtetraspora sp. AC03309]
GSAASGSAASGAGAPVSGQAAGSPAPSVEVVSPTAEPSAPPTATRRLTVPGIGMTLRENPGDAARLTAYRVGTATYVRAPGSEEFTRSDIADAEPVLSPDGTMLALFTAGTITFVDVRKGGKFTVTPTVTVPGVLERPTWSRDGKRLLLTLSVPGEKPRPSGFVLVDPAARTAMLVDTDDEARGGESQFAWLPDGSGVAVGYETGTGNGLRLRDLAGRELRTLRWVGQSYGRRTFSPSGRLFVTFCPSGGSLCLWDRATGVRQASIALPSPDMSLLGWYDDAHLIVHDPDGKKTHRVIVLDTRGREQRVLAEIPAAEDTDDLLLYYTRS